MSWRDLEELAAKGIEKRRQAEKDLETLVRLSADPRLTEEERGSLKRALSVAGGAFEWAKSLIGR